MFGIDLAVLVVVGMVLAAAASSYAMYEQGQQQKKAAKYNAKVMEQRALNERRAAQAKADDIRHRNLAALSEMTAKAGASGIALAPGTSPLVALSYNARELELDALRAEWEGNVSSDATLSGASMSRWQGESAARSSNIQAGTTLLSGVSGAGQTYAKGSTGGTWQKSSAGYSSNYNNWGSYL